MATFPNRTVAIVTTNNTTIQSDTARRSITVRLSPTDERPEDRVFRIDDLNRYVWTHRRRLLVAAIRIVQWHVARCCPQQETFAYLDSDGNEVVAPVKRFGSFEAWSSMIRSAVIGVGLPDPVLTAQHMEVVDENRAARRTFLERWRDWNPEWCGSARQMIEEVFSVSNDSENVAQGLRDAVIELVGDSGCKEGRPTPTALGNSIRQFQGRTFANLKVESDGRANSGFRWRLVGVPSP